MRQFASSGFRLWNLSTEAKLVYTGFCLCALLALVSTSLLYDDMVGAVSRASGRSVSRYYAGEAASATAAPTGNLAAGGPEIALPDEPATPIAVPMSYRKLLEVTHFHLFTIPVFLLIITHLFMLTALSRRTKVVFIVAGWLATVAHIAAPWLERYGGGGFATFYAATGAALALACLAMTVYPVWSMWWGRPRGTEPSSPPQPSSGE